jgi:hypothetical protein
MAFDGMVHDAFGSTHFHGSWRGQIEHDFKQGRGGSRGSLLELGDRLGIGGPAGLSIGRLELRQFQPTQQCARADTSGLRRLLEVALSEQRELPPVCARASIFAPPLHVRS